MLSSEVNIEEEEVLESNACCCFRDGKSSTVEFCVAVAQMAVEQVSSHESNRMLKDRIWICCEEENIDI